ncbi:MAG: magnesium transporter [Lachnospiraceae bacterium]|nr:magnesium transporter [Lachnospiraceae bacterium]
MERENLNESVAEVLKGPDFVAELLEIIRCSPSREELLDKISDYHDNDIAGAMEQLTEDERQKLYPILGAQKVSEVFTYIEDVDKYLKELKLESVAKIISHMDSDDAVDVLEEMDDSTQEQIVRLLDDASSRDVQLILSYEDDEIGSKMTTNFIVIQNTMTIRQAMRELVRQAGDNDNISTIYVTDSRGCFYGAIDLKDLITAREGDALENLISASYPYVYDHDKIGDCIERIRDYAEDSIPIVNSQNRIIGIITAQDIVDVVDDEFGDDYAKLAGLTAEEDLNETTLQSMKKRLPWLIALLFLGMGVSSVVGIFETVVAILPIVICFQSLILDMAGNVGTQSLAVTIRVLMDENLTASQRIGLVFKEMKVGFSNGLFLGIMAFIFIGLYVCVLKHNPAGSAFLISGCVGFALMVAMIISSMVGTLVPMFFHKIKVDPAVASGPLITTVNDLVAVVVYYGLTWILLINLLHIA